MWIRQVGTVHLIQIQRMIIGTGFLFEMMEMIGSMLTMGTKMIVAFI